MLRPPAIPLINIDPYFSVWTEESVFENTVHWTSKPNTMCGRVYIDDNVYHFLGQNKPEICRMALESFTFDAFSSIFTYTNANIRLTVHFTSPMLVTDLYYSSRPVAYCRVSYESLDGKPHSVKVRFIASEELCLNERGEGRALAYPVDIDGVTAIKMGSGSQKVLWRCGDDVRIDWGYFYLGVKGEATVGHTYFDEMYAVYADAELDRDALFLFAYDDIESMVYFGENLRAYWKKDGKTIAEAIAEAAAEYDSLLARCNEFSEKLKNEATAVGSEKYAELLMLSYRQIMAAHKLVIDKEGNNLYISKECDSNGCTATVDVTYPSAPIFLKYNTELLKGMLRPVMHYAASEAWPYDFAPHDVGKYPFVNGQVYYGNKREFQMPVEECGNMLVLFSAICDADNNTEFVEPYLDTVLTWSNYLIEYGEDPESQFCTDDFAGHLAHNVNLSIKAIMGIAGCSRILTRLGRDAEAEKLMATAKTYADSLIRRAANPDGSYRLAYDKPDTFSLKYNAVWDRIWGTKLFPSEFYAGEIARYKKELMPYGVPLDSRKKYTKSDWTLWAACLADNREDFNVIVDTLWSAYNTMRTFVPMTDWYHTDTSHMQKFRHRSVQGGLFIKLLFK